MYSLIIITLLAMLTPTRLRKDMFSALLSCIATPLQYVAEGLVTFRTRKSYEMALNSQIIYLEKMLNDKFNAAGIFPAIFITDSFVSDERSYCGLKGEEEAALYLGRYYNLSANYNIGNEVLYAGKTWSSLINNNQNIIPGESDTSWTAVAVSETVYLGYNYEYAAPFSFVVHITGTHHALIAQQMATMESHINKYKLLGTQYTINIL